MLFMSSNWSDIRRYYDQTWVKFSEFGDRLFYINRVTEDKVTGHDEDDIHFDLDLSDEAPLEVNYVLPAKAMFQSGSDALLLERIPARQYSRGLSSNNVMVTKVATGDRLDLTTKLLTTFVNKSAYIDLRDAINHRKNRSSALNTRCAYLQSGAIIVDHLHVAHYEKTTNTIKCKAPFSRLMSSIRQASPWTPEQPAPKLVTTTLI